MNIASIDIGSNTILLLIAKLDIINKDFTPILNKYEMPRISKGIAENGKISREKIDLLKKVLKNYLAECSARNCEVVILNATNALRIASNSNEIIKEIKDELEVDVNVISGMEEAELAYLGGISAIRSDSANSVIDIGGSSTEIIIGTNSEILFRKSFQIGAVTLSEKFIDQYPVSFKVRSKIENYTNEMLEELSEFSKHGLNAVAVAGTPTSLSCMVREIRNYSENLVEGSVLSIDNLIVLSNKLPQMLPENILIEFGSVVSGREDVIFSGSIILIKIMEKLGIDKIIVSGRGLRYGAIIKYINSIS